MNELKPGWQTSELWLTVVASVVSLLGTTGVIGSDQLPTLQALAKDLVLGVVALVSIVAYVAGRMKLKSEGGGKE